MMLEKLRREVYEANMELQAKGLVIYTFGNVSGVDRESGLVVIKPSGVDYAKLSPDNMVIVDMECNIVEGALRPSSDVRTHVELYKAFDCVGGVAHTHSTFAVGFAQARLSLPCYGTTHADYFKDAVPATRELTPDEVHSDYEGSTGRVIAETFGLEGFNAKHTPGVLVSNHGPFTWGKNAAEAVYHSVVLEEIAKMAFITRRLGGENSFAPQHVAMKHFERKHGAKAYYGQDGD